VSVAQRANPVPASSSKATASCLYVGTLTHRRTQPQREFTHELALPYIDLEEIPRLLSGRLLWRTPGLLRFRRSDFHGDPAKPLAEAVRDSVQAALGLRPSGPIRLLANLRSYGHCFNPVSFYYCFDRDGERLEAVLAEVTNTPWGERQAYVMAGGSGSFQKLMHVSPFMPMDQRYSCRAPTPGETLSVSIENHREGHREFAAALRLRRRELTPAAVRRAALRNRLGSPRTLALIYGHGLALRLRGVRAYPHPQRGGAA